MNFLVNIFSVLLIVFVVFIIQQLLNLMIEITFFQTFFAFCVGFILLTKNDNF